MKPWYIYTLHDPREPLTVRYVGWTRNVKTRLQCHIVRAKSPKDQTYCAKWKRAIMREGVEPVLTVIEQGLGEGWAEAEIKWIAYYRALVGDRLTNHADGGGGPSGHHWKLSPTTKARMSLASKGRRVSEETKAKLRAQRQGIPLSLEHRAKLSAAHVGMKRSQESIEKTAAWWRGRKHSPSAILKIRETHAKLRKGEKVPPKTPEEVRAKIAESLRTYYAKHGTRKLSDETKKKISEALKTYRSGK